MNWTLIKSAATQKKSQITLRLVVPQKRGRPHMQVSVPSVLSGPLGFDAEGVEHVNVHEVSAENKGKWLICPIAGGETKIKRLAHCIVFTVPPPAGLALQDEQEDVPYEKVGTGFIITLPQWAVPGANGEAPSKAAGEKPAALELNGNTLILGGREVKLTKQQAIIVEKLKAKFGKCVTKAALHHALYADDPDGGADEKIVDVFICKIRDLIADWPITIVTHWGNGYELRRSVT